jgi:hypothetical protein
MTVGLQGYPPLARNIVKLRIVAASYPITGKVTIPTSKETLGLQIMFAEFLADHYLFLLPIEIVTVR